MEKKVAEFLGMAIPEDDESGRQEIVVQPHEIVQVKNEELPELIDLERKIVEADKQREDLIEMGMDAFRDAFSKIESLEPKYRGRAYEVLTSLYGNVASAIRDKSDTQMKRMKLRLDQANFSKKNAEKTVTPTMVPQKVTNVVFAGDQETLKKMKDEILKDHVEDK